MSKKIILAMFATLLAVISTRADTAEVSGDRVMRYAHPDTGYKAVILDDADLLTDDEEERLLDVMKPITAYGHAVFSTDENDIGRKTGDLAESVLRVVCAPRESGTIFEIDMKNRKIYIYSDGAIYDVVTRAYANTITDNVYRHATDGRYFDCASEAFRQILRLLDGQAISQPMKHINNVLLALALGIFLNFVYLIIMADKNDSRASQGAIVYDGSIKDLIVVQGELKRVYSPKKSSSSGGGGGGSGGGGGHSF